MLKEILLKYIGLAGFVRELEESELEKEWQDLTEKLEKPKNIQELLHQIRTNIPYQSAIQRYIDLTYRLKKFHE